MYEANTPKISDLSLFWSITLLLPHTTHQALLVEIWWNSRDFSPSYDQLALVIPFA